MANYIPKNSLDEPFDKQKVREKQTPVVSEPAKDKKKSRMQRIKEQFVTEDKDTMIDYIIFDWFIPNFKEGLISMAVSCLEMIFPNRNRSRSGYYNRGYSSASYRPYVEQRDPYYNRPQVVSNGYNFNEVTYKTRGDADAVLYRMKEILTRYPTVSVADYLELSRRDASFTDNNYGWTGNSLNDVKIIKDSWSGEWYLDLPRPMELER